MCIRDRSHLPERKLTLFTPKGENDAPLSTWPACTGDTCMARARGSTWSFFEHPDKSYASHYVNLFILSCIVLSAVVMVVESIPGIHKKNTHIWDSIESFFVLTFSVELACRVWSCPDYPTFFKSGMNYVDFFSILPWYLSLSMGNSVNFAFLRILRLGRALRLVKLSRYSGGVRLITSSLAKSVDALYLFVFILLILLIVCSSAIYYTERGTYDEATKLYMREDPIRGYLCCPGSSTALCEADSTGSLWKYPNNANFSCTQTKERSPYQSIPESFWWCMVTLTTVGYGDVYPVTSLGQFFGVITQLLGVVTLALPLSIIGSNFIDERSSMLEEHQLNDLTQKNTPPGCQDPVIFPEQRIDMILERMDFIESKLQNLAAQSHVVVAGTLKLQRQFEGAEGELECINVSKTSLDAMKMLTSHMSATIDSIKPHLN
eukprot:TRINITY_DN23585_c0_g1_i2.p1 TRINITY_DN23585_c0_g1~~TRINITY_DN23585_c0_g1_i2.p1  ORF type:complete len:434 (+),score=92.75 TRINITY_DN23585_c0_g1_i2:202-1503(+)